ncbi:reverse transcriptase domain-containing protein [Tanacetum coccineum]
MPTTRQSNSFEAIEELISQCVVDALATYETNRNTINGNRNGSGSQSNGKSGSSRTMHIAQGCTYKEFLNFQPLNFTGTNGVYATYTLLNDALTWWNSYVRIVGHDAAYEISWKELIRMMTEAYCLRNQIQKLENELWNLTMKGTDVLGYTQRFQELALLFLRIVPEEEDKVECKQFDGSENSCFVATQADNKRRMENNPRDVHVQQLPYKRQNIARAYTVGPGEKKEYAGTLLLCNKCKYHHTGPCTAKCKNYKRVGHQTNDCRSLAAATNQRALMANQRTTNRGNQTENGKAWGRVYALGGGEADQDPNNITDNANA